MTQWRQLSRFLCCVGELAQRDGKHEQARDEYLTIVKFGRDCATGGPIFPMLVGNSISGMGTKGLRTLMLENTLSPEMSKTVAVELIRLEADLLPLAETLRYELIYAKQALLDINFKPSVASRLLESRGTVERVFDAAFGDVIREAEKPYWQCETKEVLRKWQLSEKGLLLSMFNRPIPRMLVSMSLPPLEQTVSRATRCEVDLRATVVVCALTGYAPRPWRTAGTSRPTGTGFLARRTHRSVRWQAVAVSARWGRLGGLECRFRHEGRQRRVARVQIPQGR